MAGDHEDNLPKISEPLPTPPSPLPCSSFTPNKGSKAQGKEASKEEEEKKEVVVHGLPPGGIVIAAGDDFGVKLFSAKEIEAAVRHGVALEPAPVLPLGQGKRRCPHPQPIMSFGLTHFRTLPSSFRKF